GRLSDDPAVDDGHQPVQAERQHDRLAADARNWCRPTAASEALGHWLAARPGGQRLQARRGNRVGDEPDAAVGEAKERAAGVGTPEVEEVAEVRRRAAELATIRV